MFPTVRVLARSLTKKPYIPFPSVLPNTHVERRREHVKNGFRFKAVGRHNKRASRSKIRLLLFNAKPLVPVQDRIRVWNIWPGDRVRLLKGKPRDKFVDPAQGAAGGWKVYTVKEHAKRVNSLKLSEYKLPCPKPSSIRPKPPNWNSMPQEEQKQWYNDNPVRHQLKLVHYSNVSLLVSESKEPGEQVFAKRLGRGRIRKVPARDLTAGHSTVYTWKRFASGLTGSAEKWPAAAQESGGRVRIPWRSTKPPRVPRCRINDTPALLAQRPTLSVPRDIGSIGAAAQLSPLLPAHDRSRAPSDQKVSDAYIFNHGDSSSYIADTVMPLYLTDELAPRFTRVKMAKAWKQRRLNEAAEERRLVKEVTRSWQDGSQDNGLREVMDMPEVGLHGVYLRPRKGKEVAQVVRLEYREELDNIKAKTRKLIYLGWKWKPEAKDGSGGWIKGPKVLKREFKIRSKARRAKQREEKLRTFTLKPGKNQYIPEGARGELEELEA